jgi:hypothetical protein
MVDLDFHAWYSVSMKLLREKDRVVRQNKDIIPGRFITVAKPGPNGFWIF